MGRKNWETPWVWYNHWASTLSFTVDVCADKLNAKCPRFWTAEQNGLKQSWIGERAFCNPPFDSSVIQWLAKGREADLALFVLPPSTDTGWFHDFLWDEYLSIWRPGIDGHFLRGRINFEGTVTGNDRGTLLVYMRRPDIYPEKLSYSDLYPPGKRSRI